MRLPILLVLLCLIPLAACSPKPKKTKSDTPEIPSLDGQWRQDSHYDPEGSVAANLAQTENYEDYEFYFMENQLAATRLVGEEPNRTRIYWTTAYAKTPMSPNTWALDFKDQNGLPVTAEARLISGRMHLMIGDRVMAFLPRKATNLQIKGYAPKDTQ
jgi:hypothetical protein